MRREKPVTVKQVEMWLHRYRLSSYRLRYQQLKRAEYGSKLEDFFNDVIKHNIQYGGDDLKKLREAYKQYKDLSELR